MQNKDYTQANTLDHPLKTLTPAQFAALGGSAVVFVRDITGHDLSSLLKEPGFDDDETYQLVVSADGTPMFVADTGEAVEDWLSDKNFGIVQLH